MITPGLADALARFAGDALGETLPTARLSPVGGGDINTSLRMECRARSFFVKLRPVAELAMFETEAESLAALSRCTALRAPGVIACAAVDAHAVLLLEWLNLRPLRDEADAVRAGEALAALHRIGNARYGWPHDNFIGSTPQANPWHENWALFFARHRLQPQLALAASHGFRGELQRNGERLCERIGAFFLDYRPVPSLLHGDLWHGNVGMLDTGEPALFDPACHFGDREADVAMTELFGGFPLAFYAAYRRAWPLDADYERRKPLYNLYHVLNHLNLFGRGYLNQAERMAARLAEELMR